MHILLPVAAALVKLRRKWGQTTPYRADRKHMSILLPVAVVLVKLKKLFQNSLQSFTIVAGRPYQKGLAIIVLDFTIVAGRPYQKG